MKPSDIAIPTAWLFTELPGYRDHPKRSVTYSAFRYEDLPPVPVELFDGTFRWLGEPPAELVVEDRPPPDEEELRSLHEKGLAPLASLRSEAARLGLRLPGAFLFFLSETALAFRVRSCTDCYFVTPSTFVPAPRRFSRSKGFFLHFMSDSQDCLYWYLFVQADGEHCVVVADPFRGVREPAFCATSFEEFVYRAWIENEIWFRLNYFKVPLDAQQQRYADHYKFNPPPSPGTSPRG